MAQWNIQNQDYLNQERSLFEVMGIATSDGNIVSVDNPFPVSLGSTNITINGSVSIPGIVEISNDEGNPIPTQTHLYDENDNEYTSLNPLTVDGEVIIGAGSTVDANILNQISVSFDPFLTDLFGRLKVSNPFTLFDSTHRYEQDGDFSDVVIGTGSTVGMITAQSTATLGIGTTEGCSLIRESKRVFSYQPGKSLQVLQTFVFNPPKTNLTQRVGYASSENGILLELNGSQLNIVKRTSVSGITTNIVVPQSEWNKDTLDGTGFSTSNPTGIKLDPSKVQIMFQEYEWLGAGSVRVGFAIDGRFIIAHQFNHANIIDGVYMTTPNLPVRYEMFNTGITTSPSVMKQICVSVQSNGGYEKKVAEIFVRRTTPSIAIGTEYRPIVSIRLTPGREDAIVLPTKFDGLPLSNNVPYVIALIKNPTLVGAAFTASESPNVQYDISATTLSGGQVVDFSYAFGSNQAGGAVKTAEGYNWDLQLGRTQDKVSDIYTVAIRTVTGTGDAVAALGFYDLT